MSSTLKVDVVQPNGASTITIGPATATITAGTITGITDLAVADGGTGSSTAAGARTNLGSTTVGDALFITASAAAARTTLGEGTISTQNANNVTITGGSITGITDLIVADGGTGVSTLGTSNNIVLGNGTSALSAVASSGTTTTVLHGNASGAPTFAAVTGPDLSLSPNTNTLVGNVALNNTANYFDGPSISQGTTGTWFASGCVTVNDTIGNVMSFKLWDGTTIIASALVDMGANVHSCIHLSGIITSPAGNIRISVKDPTSTNGLIFANASGNGKDSTLSAFRIG